MELKALSLLPPWPIIGVVVFVYVALRRNEGGNRFLAVFRAILALKRASWVSAGNWKFNTT